MVELVFEAEVAGGAGLTFRSCLVPSCQCCNVTTGAKGLFACSGHDDDGG